MLTSKLIDKRQREGDSYDQDASEQFFNPGYDTKPTGSTGLRMSTIKAKIDEINWCNN